MWINISSYFDDQITIELTFNRAIKTKDKQEESGELGREMNDRNGDGDGECVHTLILVRSMLMYGSFMRGSE